MNIAKIRPYADNVLVRLDMHASRTEETVTAGGIIVPKLAEKEPNVIATVVARGPGAYDDVIRHDTPDEHHSGKRAPASRTFCPMDPDIKPGARVALNSHHVGDRIWSDDREEYRMVRAGTKSQAGDIVGVVT